MPKRGPFDGKSCPSLMSCIACPWQEYTLPQHGQLSFDFVLSEAFVGMGSCYTRADVMIPASRMLVCRWTQFYLRSSWDGWYEN
eukprot:3095178-Amphidinium_carterae.1